MIFYSALSSIRRFIIDQGQTPCTNAIEEIKYVANENEDSDAKDDADICNDDNSNMNSDNITTAVSGKDLNTKTASKLLSNHLL